MRTKILISALSLICLAGCNGSGVGVTAGNSSSEDAGSSSVIDRLKSLVFSSSAKASIQYPAAGLIVEAILGDNNTLRGQAPGMLHVFYANTNKAVPEKLDDFAMGDIDRVIEAGPQISKDPEVSDAIRRKDRNELARLARMSAFRQPIAWATRPCMGWEVDVMPDIFAQSSDIPNQDEVMAYLHIFEASAQLTNTILTEIASKMAAHVIRDPDAAKAEARRLFYAMDPDKLQAAWTAAIAATGRGATVDMTGSKSVGWISSGSRFDCADSGLVWVRNGQPWFGQGKLTGRDYVVGLETGFSASVNASRRQTGQSSTNEGDQTSGQAGAGK